MTLHANIGGTYKQSNDVWCNIGGVWKKAVGVWTNIGGVWKDGGVGVLLQYIGAITSLSQSRSHPASCTMTTSTPYALFAGGWDNSATFYGNVDAYNSSLVRSSGTALNVPKDSGTGACANNTLGIIAGGYTGRGATWASESYNASLVRTVLATLNEEKYAMGGSNVGAYAIFAGGTDDTNYFARVECYNGSGTKTEATRLPTGTHMVTGAKTGTTYAIFHNGRYNSDVVTAYNASLVISTPATLTDGATNMFGASCGIYGMFVYSDTMNIYSNTLVKSTLTSLGMTIRNSLDIDNMAVFCGTTTTFFDQNLVKNTIDSSAFPTLVQRGASVGKYGIVAGGGSTISATAVAFQSKKP